MTAVQPAIRSRRPDRPTSLPTLLGFDYGRQRIGVATGQTVTGTATALTTLESRDGRPDWDAIAELIGEWRPDALVVGLPLHADGSDAGITSSARRFMRQLEGRFRLPVHAMDERLSSHAAAALEQPRHGDIDAGAARIILQDWLDTRA